jgi:monoterpene epsilon-lactone hydrolase
MPETKVSSGTSEAPPSANAREIPARTLPLPATASAAMQKFIALPYPPIWNEVPKNTAEWKHLAEQSVAAATPNIAAIRQRFELTIEEQTIAGVHVFVITPADVPERNRNRVLLHIPGGGFVLSPGEAGAGEGMLMAGFGHFRVVSVDYRRLPDFPFPAALDDATAVWCALQAEHDPKRMAVFGTSAGGGLTFALMLRAKAEGIALPAAIAPGTPWVDLTGEGDSLRANEFVDNVLVSMSGWAGDAAPLYAGGRDLRDPLISPIYGDFTGLPPAIITSGTRDLFLSNAVRAHRKLRADGVEAVLQVFEGVSHAQYLFPFSPEGEAAFAEITQFFDKHLAV